MALFTGAFFVAQVSLIIVAKPFYEDFRWQGRGEMRRCETQ